MATEAGKERICQDVSHCRLDQEKAADTSSTILIPGYKYYHLSRNTLKATANKKEILYLGIRMKKYV
jgi:hypothetical protein